MIQHNFIFKNGNCSVSISRISHFKSSYVFEVAIVWDICLPSMTLVHPKNKEKIVSPESFLKILRAAHLDLNVSSSLTSLVSLQMAKCPALCLFCTQSCELALEPHKRFLQFSCYYELALSLSTSQSFSLSSCWHIVVTRYLVDLKVCRPSRVRPFEKEKLNS